MAVIYIGLLRSDGTEPNNSSGYQRISVVSEDALHKILEEKQIVYPDVKAPGYGVVVAAAGYSQKEGGIPIVLWNFPESLDIHHGVVPVIYKGKLYRGVDIKATAVLQQNTNCRGGKTG